MIPSTLANNMEKCTLKQVQLLQDIAIKTYRETFADSNSERLLQQYFEDSLNLKILTAQLQQKNSEFYFIYSSPIGTAQADLAGFLKLNVGDAQTDILDPEALEVEKIYIKKDFLYKGLGKELMTFAIKRAKQQAKQFIWLGVWEHNFPALTFYKKMGFEKFSEHPFNMGGDIQTDFLLKKHL